MAVGVRSCCSAAAFCCRAARLHGCMKPVGLGMNAVVQPPPAVKLLTWQCFAVRTFVVVVVVAPLVMQPTGMFLLPPLPCRPPQLALLPLPQPLPPFDKEMPRLRSRWLSKLASFALVAAVAVMALLALSFLPRCGVSNDTRFIMKTDELIVCRSGSEDIIELAKREEWDELHKECGRWRVSAGEGWGFMVREEICRQMVQECSGWWMDSTTCNKINRCTIGVEQEKEMEKWGAMIPHKIL